MTVAHFERTVWLSEREQMQWLWTLGPAGVAVAGFHVGAVEEVIGHSVLDHVALHSPARVEGWATHLGCEWLEGAPCWFDRITPGLEAAGVLQSVRDGGRVDALHRLLDEFYAELTDRQREQW